MSITGDFDQAASLAVEGHPSPSRKRKKRAAPFSLRLSETERAQLVLEAGGLPLGTYLKAKVLGLPTSHRGARGIPVQDRLMLAQALAMVGRANLTATLAIMADAASTGSLIVTPEIEHEIMLALADVRAVRVTLMKALGLKPEDRE